MFGSMGEVLSQAEWETWTLMDGDLWWVGGALTKACSGLPGKHCAEPLTLDRSSSVQERICAAISGSGFFGAG